MDLKEELLKISERILTMKDSIVTEEATKNAYILPFIKALGYDVFNPLEVVPEYVCDIGTKKGEKIDYAICKDGVPIILIECKHWKENLTLYDNQLLRYYNVSKAKFGILTNGIIYRFYTDLETHNLMDEKPFLEVDMTSLLDTDIEQLRKFHKTCFSESAIYDTANVLKLENEIRLIVKREFENPTPEFVRFFIKEINDGRSSAKMIDTFSPIVKKVIKGYISDTINDRLSNAMGDGKEEHPNIELPEGAVSMSDDGRIVTTQEELDAYMVVKNIARQIIDVSRVIYADYQSYFVIAVDDPWRWICRINFKKKLCIAFPDDQKWIELKSLDEIYNYSERIVECIKNKRKQQH